MQRSKPKRTSKRWPVSLKPKCLRMVQTLKSVKTKNRFRKSNVSSVRTAQLHKLFTQLDKNNNGVLEFDEFAIAVNKLRGENLPDEAIKLLLREADTNHDNVVSYDEFTRFLAAEKLEAKKPVSCTFLN